MSFTSNSASNKHKRENICKHQDTPQFSTQQCKQELMLWKEDELCLWQQACVWPKSDTASELQQKYSSILYSAAVQSQDIFVSSLNFLKPYLLILHSFISLCKWTMWHFRTSATLVCFTCRIGLVSRDENCECLRIIILHLLKDKRCFRYRRAETCKYYLQSK